VEEQEPGAFQTVELRARLLRATGKDREARELLQKYAEEKDAPLLAVAALLEELGEGAAAEPLYRKYAAVPDQPEKALFLAAYLGRRGRFAEALDLLEQAWKTCPPQAVAFTAVAMLHAPGARAEHFERVARDLETALAKNPDLVPVLLHLATLRDLQGRHAEAEQVYRRLLNRAPDNVVALNNLAWLLAHQKGKGNEALSLLRRAIDTAGPLPELRDTRAVVSLSLGESKAAVEDLEAVVREAPTATRYFHLARAELLAGHRGSALDALGKAKAAGLKAEALHPLERASYQPLLKELGRP